MDLRKAAAAMLTLACGILYLGSLEPSASAEGARLGVLTVWDGGTICNRTTGGANGVLPTAWSIDYPKKFTLVCDQAAYIGTDVGGCDAGVCMTVAAGEKVTLQVLGSTTALGNAYNWDGGAQSTPYAVTYTGGWVCAAPQSGAVLTCNAYPRSGFE